LKLRLRHRRGRYNLSRGRKWLGLEDSNLRSCGRRLRRLRSYRRHAFRLDCLYACLFLLRLGFFWSLDGLGSLRVLDEARSHMRDDLLWKVLVANALGYLERH
jgi:hypothetical protein